MLFFMPFVTLDTRDMHRKMNQNDLLVNINTDFAGDDIARTTKLRTNRYVPVRTGKLMGGFDWKARWLGDSLVVDMEYDAEDPRDGYHYAEIQEDVGQQIAWAGRPFNHPIHGVSPYFSRGFEDVDVPGSYAIHIRRALR